MLHINQKVSVNSRQEEQPPPPLPPKVRHQGRTQLPLPGEHGHQSLLQRRGLTAPTRLTADINTQGESYAFRQLAIKTSARLDLNNFVTGIHHQRFRDIDTCKVTQLVTPQNTKLSANHMKVDKLNLAMRSQYPKPEGLRDHLCMLADQKPGVLVVLSSDNDITTRQLPPYFRQDGEYGDVSVKCKINREAHFATAGNLNLRNYRIEITAGGKTTPISVMHVNNWKDQTTVDAKALKTLVAHIN